MGRIKIIGFLSLPLLLIITFVSCKKGVNDPSITFQTRTSRLTGDWKVKSFIAHDTLIVVDNDGSIETTIRQETLENGDYSVSGIEFASNPDSDPATIFETKGKYAEYAYSFNKSGTFEMVRAYEIEVTVDYVEDTYDKKEKREIIDTVFGFWNFIGPLEGIYKNKERIILHSTREKRIESYSLTKYSLPDYEILTHFSQLKDREEFYENGTRNEVWVLDKLSNDEIEVSLDLSYVDSDLELQFDEEGNSWEDTEETDYSGMKQLFLVAK